MTHKWNSLENLSEIEMKARVSERDGGVSDCGGNCTEAGRPGALAGFSFTSFTCKSRTSALPIDMNGSATEESTKILKHKPKQFSSAFIQVGKTIFAVGWVSG